jgi:O-antigen/teichoic acid export membrane protein
MLSALNKVGSVLLLRVLAAGMSFYMASCVTKVMSINESGIFFFTTTLILMLASISTFGLQNVVLKNYSGVVPREGVLHSFFITSAIVSILLSIISYKYVQIELVANSWIFVVLLLISTSILQISSLAFQAIGNFNKSILFQTLLLNSFLVVQIIFLDITSISEFILSFTLSSLLCCLLSIILLRNKLYIGNELDVVGDLKSGKEFLFINTLSQLLMLGGAVISKANLTNEEFAILSVCLRISALLNFLIVAINFVYTPVLIKTSQINRPNAYLILKKISILSTLFSVPMVLFLIYFSNEILTLFGSEYISGKIVLFILISSQLTVSFLGAGGQFMVLSGYEVTMRKIMIVTVTCSLIFSYVGSYYFGLVGAATGVAFSIAFQNILIIIKLKSKFGVFVLSPVGLYK